MQETEFHDMTNAPEAPVGLLADEEPEERQIVFQSTVCPVTLQHGFRP